MNRLEKLVSFVFIAGAGILLSLAVGVKDPGTAVPTNAPSSTEARYPEPTDYVVDEAGVLTPEQLSTLRNRLKLMDTSKHQLAVAIVKTTAPLSIEEYGIKLAEKWKVGDADLDNGAIIVIATDDRKVRIEVGYGLEGDIPDSAAGRILDNDMVPFLKKNDWYGAINAGLAALSARVK